MLEVSSFFVSLFFFFCFKIAFFVLDMSKEISRRRRNKAESRERTLDGRKLVEYVNVRFIFSFLWETLKCCNLRSIDWSSLLFFFYFSTTGLVLLCCLLKRIIIETILSRQFGISQFMFHSHVRSTTYRIFILFYCPTCDFCERRRL